MLMTTLRRNLQWAADYLILLRAASLLAAPKANTFPSRPPNRRAFPVKPW